MTSIIASIDTQHSDMIHDVQYDYYGTKFATASSDKSVCVFYQNGEIHHKVVAFKDHEAPVWQVSWAHPRFGVILASCSYDATVNIYREVSQNNWSKIYDHKYHESSVNSISWAPHEYGLILACASSDGKVSTVEYREGAW